MPICYALRHEVALRSVRSCSALGYERVSIDLEMKVLVGIPIFWALLSAVEVGAEDPFEESQVQVGEVEEYAVLNSVQGDIIASHYTKVAFGRFHREDASLRGFSVAPDERKFEVLLVLERGVAARLVKLLRLGDTEMKLSVVAPSDLEKVRNSDLGFEISDGRGFVRVYSLAGGDYCRFFTSSGVLSGVFRCSAKAKRELSAIVQLCQSKLEDPAAQ